MLKKLDAELNIHQTALRIRSQRQELLSSNIANADTPQYKARDIDFKAAMQSAMQQAAGANPVEQRASLLNQTNSEHKSGDVDQVKGHAGDVLFRSLVQGSVDGNTVDMDLERNAYVDNSVRYEAGLTFVTDKVKEMMTAIKGEN
ncbi:MAG: flagellar basal body rod protein FlgB [Methylophilus sp.]|jgi:flagellar basal-body rod protein FlgB|uniref:flagellar basal body rod protein FlgB n=1 Tax=Methylophilus sp. TaxID=29541 RepID=UPI00403502E9